jgi:outer membrane protein assembly factor BamB
MLACGCKRRTQADPPPTATPTGELAQAVNTATADSAECPSPDPPALVDVAPAPAGAAPQVTCKVEPWTTYGKDARRTSATAGCCVGPLKEAWRARATTNTKARPPLFEHPIADDQAVYAVGLRGKSSTGHKFTLDGKAVWTFDSRADLHLANWPTLAHDVLIVNDDGFYMVNLETGKNMYARGLDTFGQTASDEQRLYLVNTWHVEGPGLFVGAFTPEGVNIWKRNKYGSEPHDMMDDLGAIALDNGLVFQAANYKFANFSGVFAFDRETGEMRWSKAAKPIGFLSASDGRIYTVERGAQGRQVVARSQADGSVFWSTPMPTLRAAAPVVAGGLVIVDTEKDGVHALEADSGKVAWIAPIKSTHKNTVGQITTLAAALGSKTLVATVDGTIHILSLDDGSERFSLCLGGRQEVHSPVLVGERLYVVANGELVAFWPE